VSELFSLHRAKGLNDIGSGEAPDRQKEGGGGGYSNKGAMDAQQDYKQMTNMRAMAKAEADEISKARRKIPRSRAGSLGPLEFKH
jgi:hypothetical protein